jgi:hypothetical protein
MTRTTTLAFVIPVSALLLVLTPFSDANTSRVADLEKNLPLIEELNESVQSRLLKPLPKSLGMSRIMIRSSFGDHFRPLISDRRDFAPENEQEKKVLSALEERKVQVGLYLFGESILREDSKEFSFRALKGPGAITAGTPRPKWYPSKVLRVSPPEVVPVEDRLPDWAAIYPVAQRAMKSFQDGGRGFEMEFHGWTLAARPALAVNEKCVSCHNNKAYLQYKGNAKLGDPLGGVLYAFRPTPEPVSASTARPHSAE